MRRTRRGDWIDCHIMFMGSQLSRAPRSRKSHSGGLKALTPRARKSHSGGLKARELYSTLAPLGFIAPALRLSPRFGPLRLAIKPS
jgi:hypothetical protein